MPDVKWIKLSTDLFDNRKIKHIRKMPEGNSILLIWIFLLTLAGRCNAGGMIFLTENIPYTVEMLADESGFDLNTVKLALEVLSRFDMISTDPLLIDDWENHQNIEGLEKVREQTRKRVADHRARQKALTESNATCNVTVTPSNAIEEEREEDKDKEREYSSSSSFAREDFSDKNERKLGVLGGELGKGFVRLSQEQTDDLLDRLSVDEFDHYVGVVAKCEMEGKHYTRGHYQAILDMVARDRRIAAK